MKLITSLEMRFDRTPHGEVWTQAAFAYPQMTHFLDKFEALQVMARVRDVVSVPADWVRADGPSITYVPLPYFVGPRQYLSKAGEIRQIARETIGENDAVILHIPSQIATLIESVLQQRHHPYGVRVIGNPYDVFAPGTVDHPLRRFFRWRFTRNQQRQCQEACAAAYVTEYSLQQRYPPGSETLSTFFSISHLTDESFVAESRPLRRDGHPFHIVTVGSLEQLYKGTDVLINAMNAVVKAGLQLELSVIGDGKFRPQLEDQTRSLGLSNVVHFLGQLTAGQAVRDQLDQADLFILPSRTEGLPRAIIEAMARALPCIGSTAGGIPELLLPEDLVPPDDAKALADKIYEVLSSPERMSRMSARNLAEARKYHMDELAQRRNAFYQHVKDATLGWQQNRKS